MSKFLFFAAALPLFITFSISYACNPQDLAALLAFKNSFPPNSFPNYSWTTDIDCCNWDYISCDDNTGRVTTLSIQDSQSIKGSIPTSVGDLSALQVISLSNLPNLSGQIPSQFSKLTGLQFLTIYETKVSGPVPSYLSTFTGLKEINLINSNFVGTVPSSIGGLVNLSTIDLSGNQLTGAIPDSLFSQLSGSLADLDLSDNTLKGPIPQTFANIEFTNINLGSNQLTGDASFLFGESKQVTQVILSKNKLAFNITGVEFPRNLQYLDISHNKIYGSISNQITELKNLRYLDVSHNKLCGKIPSGTPLPPCNKKNYQG